MKYPTKFDIKLEEPSEAYSGPPEDPLGELTQVEMGLWRFCYECNHRVLIQIGSERKFVFLDYDFSLLLPELPGIISELTICKNIELDFSESFFYIKFQVVDNKINCSLNDFGSYVKVQEFELERSQVLEVLEQFFNKIIQMALEGGYIRLEEVQEFRNACTHLEKIDIIAQGSDPLFAVH